MGLQMTSPPLLLDLFLHFPLIILLLFAVGTQVLPKVLDSHEIDRGIVLVAFVFGMLGR